MGKAIHRALVGPIEDFPINQMAVARQTDALSPDTTQGEADVMSTITRIQESVYTVVLFPSELCHAMYGLGGYRRKGFYPGEIVAGTGMGTNLFQTTHQPAFQSRGWNTGAQVQPEGPGSRRGPRDRLGIPVQRLGQGHLTPPQGSVPGVQP